MASFSKRDKNGSSSTPKKPHFIRIILSDIMKNQKSAIPQRFLRNHGKSLSKSALLKVPSGETWKVELLKHKDEVSFAKDWEKFIAYYSIDYGDFLVFEYEGNSLFNIFIIDKSFTEVGYPWNSTDGAECNQEDKLEDPEDDDDASVEFTEVSSNTQETRKGTKGKEKLVCSGNSEEYKGDHGERLAENKCHPGGTPLEVLEHVNPRFTVQIKDSHLPPRSTLNIPSGFVRKYFKEAKGNATLDVLDGGSWPVKYCACGTSNEARIRFQGLGDFARDNCLAVENICSFDLPKVERNKVTFQVSISRPNQH